MKRARKKNSKRNNLVESTSNIYDYDEQFDEKGADNEDFAVTEQEDILLSAAIEEFERGEDISDTAEDFAVPEESFEITSQTDEDFEVSDAAEDEDIPFAAAAFPENKENDAPNTAISEQPQHSEDYLKRKAMNKKKFEQKRRKKRIRTIIISVLIIIFVGGGAILGMDFSGGDGDEFTTPVDVQTGKINVLLLGVDKDGERSDSIMLVSYDFDDHTINLLSVPRDTKMYVTDRNVTRKITEVHGMHDSSGNMYGAAAVAESVTSLTGIPINYYLEFSFSALDNVMDILGPVEFDVPDIEGGGRGMNYDDGYQNLHIHLKPGLQELSGNQIQQFLRYRKSNNGTSDGSDISRVGRQQELLKAIIDQKVNIELIIKIPDIFKEVKSQLKTNFTIKDVIKYAGYLKDISSENMNTYVLPGESARTSGAWYYVYDGTATAQMITESFGYEVTADELTNEISLTGKKASGKTQQTETKKSTSSASSSSSSGSTSTVSDESAKTTKTTKPDESTASADAKKNTPTAETKKNTQTADTEKTDTVKDEPEEKTSNASEADEPEKNEEKSDSAQTADDGDDVISLD